MYIESKLTMGSSHISFLGNTAEVSGGAILIPDVNNVIYDCSGKYTFERNTIVPDGDANENKYDLWGHTPSYYPCNKYIFKINQSDNKPEFFCQNVEGVISQDCISKIPPAPTPPTPPKPTPPKPTPPKPTPPAGCKNTCKSPPDCDIGESGCCSDADCKYWGGDEAGCVVESGFGGKKVCRR